MAALLRKITTLAVWPAALVLLAGSEAVSAPAGTLRIEGSWAGRGVVRALAWQFQSMPNHGVVSFLPRDSLQVVPLLAHDKLAMGLVLDSRVPRADKELGPQFRKHTLGRFVLAVVVNRANSTRHITLEELAHVYQGWIRSWQELRKSRFAGDIEVYAPPLAGTEGCVFRARVLKGAPYGEQLRRTSARGGRQKRSAGEVMEAVARQRDAIGFMLYGWEEKKMDSRVRLLAVARDANSSAVLPSARTIENKSYPLCDTLSLRLHPHASPMAREFCSFATGLQAARIIEPFGLFSERRWQQRADKWRLARVTGKAVPVVASGTEEGTALMRDLATAFTKATAPVKLQYKPTSKPEAIKTFLDRSELLFVEGVLGASNLGQYATQWDTQRPQEVPVGRTVVGIVVHPANRVHTLSLKDLASIFSGQVFDWSEVNPPKRPAPVVPQPPSRFPVAKVVKSPIRLYALRASNPLEPLLREKLRLSHLARQTIRRRDTPKVVDAVAKSVNAIGFVDLSQLPSTDSSVKLVKLLLPSRKFAVSARDRNSEDYPLARRYTLYASPRASETTREFVKFLLSGGGAETIAKNGLQPAIVAKSSVSAFRHAVDSRLEKRYSKKSR